MLLELKAMGVDKAVLVSAREFGGSDTFATSQILAAAIKSLGVDKDDIIFCGRQAIDGDTAQVGPRSPKSWRSPGVLCGRHQEGRRHPHRPPYAGGRLYDRQVRPPAC